MRNQLPPTYLNPGQSVVIENRRGDSATKGMCKILGSREPCYLLVDMPLANGQPILAPTDSWCIVRALSKGKAIGFRAKIERIHSDPFPIVVLSYPGEVQEVTVRKAERISCDIPVLLLARAAGQASAAPSEEPEAKQEDKAGVEKGATASEDPQEVPPAAAPETPKDPPQHHQAAGGEVEPDQGAAPAAPNTENEGAGDVRRRPEEPFAAIIIDLSEGGCQLAVPSIHPDIPTELPSEVLRQIRPERRLLHHPKTLKEAFRTGDMCAVQLELPLQESPVIHEACGEIRWAKVFHHYHLLGLQFVQVPVPLGIQIRKMIEFQARFFTPPFEPL